MPTVEIPKGVTVSESSVSSVTAKMTQAVVHPQPAEVNSVQAQTQKEPATDTIQVCWAGEKSSPLRPDHQVELLHLQAEADALLLKLQAVSQPLQQP